MSTFQLTQHNTKVHFLASHGVRSVRIVTLAFDPETAERTRLRLVVWDENNVPLWQTFPPDAGAAGPFSVEKSFAVQDQLTLEVQAEPNEPFSVTVLVEFNEPDADYVPDVS